MSMDSVFKLGEIIVNENQLAKFSRFYDMLIDENEKYNLTSITEKQDVYVKHFLDSILIDRLNYDFSGKSMIDIGTGAGFPAIPLKIMHESLMMTGLDALNKRIGFIQMVCDELNLKDVHLIHGRAEDFGQDPLYRERYDFAVSRAVAELRLLLEYVMPFVKVNGYFLAYKSLKTKTELDEAQNAMKIMKCKLIDIAQFELPFDYGTRDIMIIQKTGKLDRRFPRKAGTPKKSPL